MGSSKGTFDYVNEIWGIADYIRGAGIQTSDFNKVILPFVVLRRLECALEPTRDAVCKRHEKGTWADDDPKYCALSEHCFYNLTSFTLSNLGAVNTYKALMAYVDGFSENARSVLKKFELDHTAAKLEEQNVLYEVCTRFAGFDLGPDAVSDRMMSDIYEHLIQRYGEEISEGAEDFMTPRDVVRLATSLLFANEDEVLAGDSGEIRSVYDGTCGTGGFLADALDLLDEWHDKGQLSAPTRFTPYGQEFTPVTWAMGKSAMMLRNVAGGDVLDQMNDLSANIAYGDTLSNDRFAGKTFDYQLTNPPYGKDWNVEKPAVLGEMTEGFAGRFGAGKPASSDGSMLFIQNVAAKMKAPEEGGGKAAIVLSGSPLFNGDAGSGEASIRRWLLQEDLIDCIVQLPTDIFFRTGITTYIWILNNRKPANRQGMVQLIDASDRRTALRKTQGNKRFKVSEADAEWVVRTYVDGHDHGKSVMVPATDFMYRKVTTQRPLRVRFDVSEDKVGAFKDCFPKLTVDDEAAIDSMVSSNPGRHDYAWALDAASALHRELTAKSKPSKDKIVSAMVDVFGTRDESAPVALDAKGEPVWDKEFKDSENVPYSMDVDEYMAKEVLPYAPDAVVDETVTDEPKLDKKTGITSNPLGDGKVGVVGASISFNRYFYEYEKVREPEAVADEIRALQAELDGSLEEVLGR